MRPSLVLLLCLGAACGDTGPNGVAIDGGPLLDAAVVVDAPLPLPLPPDAPLALPDARSADAPAPPHDAKLPPDAAKPPDAKLIDASLPDAGLPDASLPDARLPDARLPDAKLPSDAKLPPDAAPPPDAGEPDAAPGNVSLGAHALGYHRQHDGTSPLETPPLSTQQGSVIVVSVGRGDFGAFTGGAPTDNKGNGAYPQLGTAHTYTLWPSSGTAIFARVGAAGGADHVLIAQTPPADELTMAAVEVVGGTHIQDTQWKEVLAGAPLTSASVTTAGPAVLVAFWWGDADVNGVKTATPNNGFQVLDAILLEGALVQCAVAARVVAGPGTYDVTWTATPLQGAQLWLIAVE